MQKMHEKFCWQEPSIHTQLLTKTIIQFYSDEFDNALVKAVEKAETEALLDEDMDWFTDYSSPMIIPSFEDDSNDPSINDSSLTYNKELKDWIHSNDEMNMDQTILPEIEEEEEEMDMDEFLIQLEEEALSSTRND